MTYSKKRRSAAAKVAWTDKKSRKKRIASIRKALRSKKERKRRRLRSKRLWKKGSYRRNVVAGLRRHWKDPVAGRKHARRVKKARWGSDGARTRQSEAMLTCWRRRRNGELVSPVHSGRARPYISIRQGIRRFWYYGNDCRIKMRSRWEVAYAHWLDSEGIDWLYESVTFVTEWWSWTPDFYLKKKGIFVEVKGAKINLHPRTLNVLRTRLGTPIVVLFGEDLQKMGILDAHLRVVARERRIQ